MTLIGSINNQGSIQGQINNANGILTGVISNAGLLGGQVVGLRGFKGDKGETGDTGATGNGIASLTYVSSVGLVDTYKITYTNGNETTFTVTNGQDGNDGHSPVVTATKSGKKTYISVDGTQIAEVDDGADGTNGTNGVGISSIAKTSTAGKVDTYTITYTDSNTATFTVTNGNDGASGHSPVVTASKAGKTTTVSVDGTAIATILDGNDGNSPTITTSKAGKTTTILSDGTSIGTVLDGDDGNSPVITTSKTGGTTTIYSDGVSIGTVDDGDKGDTPVITASKTGSVTTIYADGVSIATINDGADGADGVVQDVEVNGTSVLSGTVAEVTVPTKTSDLSNDSLFPRGNKATFYGTCATAGATKTVTCADFTSADLTAGVTIVVSFSVANTGAVADLTLNVNSTGAYHIKYNNAGTISNLGDKSYLKASTYMFYFDGTYWVITGYDTNTNTIGYTIRTNGLQMKMKTACYRYRICFTSANGEYLVPANSSTSTSATASKTVTTEKIDPWGRIVYYNSSTAVSANSYPTASYLCQQYNGVTLGYSFNRTGVALTLSQYKPVYVKATPQSDGSAIIDGETPFVQALPSTEDGKIYIFIGVATGATTIEFTLEHPVYYYKDSQIRLWTNQTSSGGGGTITDVEVNGTSVVSGGVASVTVPTDTNDLTNGAGFIATETDPVFTASDAYGISSTDISNWNGKADAVHTHTKSDVTDFAHTHTKSEISDFPSIPTITDTYSGTSSDGMSGKAVKSAIDALDGTVSGTAGAGKTLTAFSQTDGKVSATFGNISITKSQVSDFPTIPTVNNATLTIQKNGTTVNTFTANASSNVTANISVPTDTNDLTNGAGFITTETDPTVPSWAKASTKPSYTASEVGALPDTTTIPSNTSDLNNDSGFLTSSAFEIKDASTTFTMASGGAQTVSLNSTKSGYYPLGIVGIAISGTNSGYAVPRSFEIINVTSGSCTVSAYITNRSTSTGTWTASFHVLWVKE